LSQKLGLLGLLYFSKKEDNFELCIKLRVKLVFLKKERFTFLPPKFYRKALKYEQLWFFRTVIEKWNRR